MRARVAAPLVAALLGITGGTVTALVAGADGKGTGEPAIEDPLGLGIPLVRLECSPGKGILVLGFGDTRPPLQAAQAGNPAGHPSYLETEESCPTIYGSARKEQQPRYAVFLGPFDDLVEPCTLRMDPARRGDFVTALRSGNSDTVKCVCVLPDSADRPTLRVGMTPTEGNAVWVRSVQGMLSDADDDRFPPAWVTGVYDRRTADRVADIQATSRSGSDPGVVDDDTWALLTTRLCDNYDF
jgi:hypothetical protein